MVTASKRQTVHSIDSPEVFSQIKECTGKDNKCLNALLLIGLDGDIYASYCRGTLFVFLKLY